MFAVSNKRPFVRNSILAGLSLPDLAAVGESVEPIFLRERMVLHEPRRRIEHVYFIQAGVVSLRIVAAHNLVESAMVGFQGAVGASSLFGGHISTHQSVVLFPGNALRVHVDCLRSLIKKRDHLCLRVSRYAQALLMHSAQSGLCGVRHDLEQRVACWVCLACDALGGHALHVTHDYLSDVLGLRRAGVTEALIRFENEGLIYKARGLLQVKERKRLEQRACSCYRIISSEYASAELATSAEQPAPPLVPEM
jgi:CRP-like cAMP-binding protein